MGIKAIGTPILLALTAAALLIGCGSDAPPLFDATTARSLQASLDDSIAAISVPGAVMTVIRPDGARWVGASGMADFAGNRAMTAGLKFRIGSLTKTFTAVVILQLVQEGRLSLDDTLALVLPGLVPNDDRITIRQLLNHTSGLFDYAQEQNPNFLDGLLDHSLRFWTREELIAIATAHGPYSDPGFEFHYSNTNYVLLGMIIEKLTGHSYAQEVRTRILDPLGLRSTSVPDSPVMPARSVRGYTWGNNGWVDTTTFDTSWAFATGSLISNGADLEAWIAALMKGVLLDEERKAAMFTFFNMGSTGAGYGLGLEKQQSGAIGHTGDFVYGGQAAMYEYQGWRFIVLTNASPAQEIELFGSEYIMYRAMRTIGIC